MSGLALALGPTVGGLMVEHLGWQSVFFLNVPIGIIALLTASRTVRESVSEVTRELDIPGLLLGSGALFCATYALIEANEKGWSDPLIVSMLVASAVLAVAFLLFERQSPKAMLPLRFFRIPAFSAGATVAFSVSFGMFATFFFMSLYMQLIRGYSAFEAGVRFLPDDRHDHHRRAQRGEVRLQARLADPHDVRLDPGGHRPPAPVAASRSTRRTC